MAKPKSALPNPAATLPGEADILANVLADLSDDMPAESIVRALLARSVDRLHLLCGTLLFRSYPRLARPPLNLQSEEMLSAVVERLLKAMREIRPRTVRRC